MSIAAFLRSVTPHTTAWMVMAFLFAITSVASSQSQPRDTTPATLPSGPASESLSQWQPTVDHTTCADTDNLGDDLQELLAMIDDEVRRAHELSVTEETRYGEELFEEMLRTPESMLYGRLDPPQFEADRRYVEAVGRSLLTNLRRQGIDYRFHLLLSDEVNAFALPGGHIIITTAMLYRPDTLQNEAELAGILAHEIAHVDLRHTAAVFETVRAAGFSLDDDSALNISLLFNRFGRLMYQSEYEDAADRYAVRRLVEVGYSPIRIYDQWQRWSTVAALRGLHPDDLGEAPAWARTVLAALSSHNPAATRACNVGLELEAMRTEAGSRPLATGYMNFQQRQPLLGGSHGGP